MKTEFHSHDLHLPDWGPYTKRYSGISHIPDVTSGVRFDMAVFPGMDNYRTEVPNVCAYSGYHVWDALPDLSRYTLRYEMLWKDKLYADISFLAAGPELRLIRADCRNYTGERQQICLNYAASAFYPTPSGSRTALPGVDVDLPPEAVLLAGSDYEDLRFAVPRLRDPLGWDGMRRAEEPLTGSVKGYGLGQGFGESGDRVCYRFLLHQPLKQPSLGVRYRNPGDKPTEFRLTGGEQVILPPSDEWTVIFTSLEQSLPAGSTCLTLTAISGGTAKIDSLFLCERENQEQVRFAPHPAVMVPQIEPHLEEGFLLLHYPQISACYGFLWTGKDVSFREHPMDDLEACLRFLGRDPVSRMPIQNGGSGHWTHILQRPISLEPGEGKSVYTAVCHGTDLADTAERCRSLLQKPDALEQLWRTWEKTEASAALLAGAETYLSSQKRMQALLCTNVVYPVYTRGQYIRHNTPGRIWDSLYTWDSGFAGMGLLQYSLQRAFDCLDAYLTPPGDDETAFIHHGSLVPTQFYLFVELWNRTGSQKLAQYCYPRLKQYYAFISGHASGSTLGSLASGLLRPWDYFYNSGGWDDYPPQKEIHEKHLEACVSPVVTTAHVIRCAKILRYMATRLGLTRDVLEYQQDIDRMAGALQAWSWDPEAGYFGYVLHDAQGEPQKILRTEQGENFNKGLGGASPLFADVCTPEQEARLWRHLEDPKEIWSECGLSTVDQSASYYRSDGYWNGAVWMPYQWMYFKAALDHGKSAFARQIAYTALELWARETDETYNCYEHFMIASRRGAGWHQFGALSAPVTQWFAAYYVPGTVTTGFNTFLRHCHWEPETNVLEVELDVTKAGRTSVLAAVWDGACGRVTKGCGRILAEEHWEKGAMALQLDIQMPGTLTLRIAPPENQE